MKNSFQILIASSNKHQSHLITRELLQNQPSSLVETIDKKVAAIRNLQYKNYDVVIIESDLLDSTKLEFFSAFKKSRVEIPLIFLAINKSEIDNIKSEFNFPVRFLVKEGNYLAVLPKEILEIYLENKKRLLAQKISEKRSLSDNHSLVNLTASTLSHEINNPLMTILGTTELILDNIRGTRKDSELETKMKMIQSSAEQIQTALDNLIRISKICLKDSLSGRLIEIKSSPLLHKSRSKSF